MKTFVFFGTDGHPAVIVTELTVEAAFHLARMAMQWPEIFYPAFIEIPPCNLKTVMLAEVKATLIH